MTVTSHKSRRNELTKPTCDYGNGIILDQESDRDGDMDSEPNEIPLSDLEDLSGEGEGDVFPHQRLTINNISALIKATSSIAVPLSNAPFSEHQSVISAVQISIPDINDDLNRELTFYKQCLDAVNEGRSLLKREGVPFTRPTDYFAEMVKTDEHMGKIKQKMTDEAANKKAAAEARRQRDLKKFGKQMQVAKLQERDKSKRETLEKINLLKRSNLNSSTCKPMPCSNMLSTERRNADNVNAQEEDLFDVALEDTKKVDQLRSITKGGTGAQLRNKRQKKDAKFGFGGKKRFSKSGDALSSGDMKDFSSKKMKGHKASAARLGKSRRAKRF